MLTEVLKTYLSEIPVEVRLAIKSLSDDRNLAVLVALVKEGEQNFNELKSLFKATTNELEKILKSLKSAGLIRKYVCSFDDIGNSKKVFYEATDFANYILSCISLERK